MANTRTNKKTKKAQKSATTLKVRPPTPWHHTGSAALKFLAQQDPALGRLIKAAGKCRLGDSSSDVDADDAHEQLRPYEFLFESILFQQLNGKAATTILNRLKALFGGKRPGAKEFLELGNRDETQIRGAGVSGNKFKALMDLATKESLGLLPDTGSITQMSDDEVIEALTQVRGIGPWTVHMYLIFELGRPDVFPSTDFGVQNGYRIHYKKRAHPKPKALENISKKWAPYRSTAAWYLWRAVDLKKDLIKKEKSAKTKKK